MTYFVAIDQILRADLAVTDSMIVLTGNNIAYAAPFAMIPLLIAFAGDRFKPLLEETNSILIKVSDFVLPLVLGLLGLALIIDAVLYFTRGSGLL